jgi:hypothetical protein
MFPNSTFLQRTRFRRQCTSNVRLEYSKLLLLNSFIFGSRRVMRLLRCNILLWVVSVRRLCWVIND